MIKLSPAIFGPQAVEFGRPCVQDEVTEPCMSNLPPRSIRPEWLFELSGRMQRLAGTAAPDIPLVLRGLPRAESRFERLLSWRAGRGRLRSAEAARAPDAVNRPQQNHNEIGSRSSRVRAAVTATEVVRREFAKRWTLDALARTVGSNRTDLENSFRALTGMTVHGYLTASRIDAAKRLLRYTSYSCGGIATAVGYSSKSSFYLNFKRLQGMTPDEYRRRWTFVRVDRQMAELILSHFSCRF